MFSKQKLFRLSILLFISCIVIISLAARGCPKHSGNKSTGNSNAFVINAPSNLTAISISSYRIDLSWKDNSNNENGFEIERNLTIDTAYLLIATVNSNSVSYSDNSVTSTNTYYYRVRAFNTIGDRSSYSNVAEAFTFDYAWLFPVTAIAAGYSHSIALTSNGNLWSWGLNITGQLGLGDWNNRTIPNLIQQDWNWNPFGNVAVIAANTNSSNSFAVKTDGTIWGWGQNDSYQLGIGDTWTPESPLRIGNDSDWARLASGEWHTLGLKTTGTLWAWGNNANYRLGLGDKILRLTPTQVTTETDWFLIAAGNGHSLGLKTRGTLWAWGKNDYGQLGLLNAYDRETPTQVTTEIDWSVIAAGRNHSLGIKTTGTLWAWGDNDYGQLGVGNTDNGTPPIQVTTETDWSIITAGSNHSLGIKTTGTLWAWGRNDSGQLGLGDADIRTTPTQVTTETDWSIIAAGLTHSLGVKTNGRLWVWGQNQYGQLGTGDTSDRNIPFRLGIPALPSDFTATAFSCSQINLSWIDNAFNETGFNIERKISTTAYSQIATVGSNIISYPDEGLVYGTEYFYWVRAYNDYGDSPYSNETSATPTVVAPSLLTLNIISDNRIDLIWQDNSPDESGFKIERKITPNGTWTEIAAVNPNITIYSDISETGFAHNTYYYYRVKAWNSFGESVYSEAITIFGYWVMIAVGYNQTFGIKTNGTIWAWGSNRFGQLGLGDSGITTNRNTPTQVGTTSEWSACAAGYAHTLGRKSNGTIWSWGRNNYGQLGLGHTININTPAQIGSDADWSMISSGYQHTISLKQNGTIWAWGYNGEGELGLGDYDDRWTSTQIGNESNWSQIAAGSFHTVAIKNNKTVWVWGTNDYGQLGLGDSIERYTPTQIGTLSDWVNIAAGEAHTIGIKTDGTLWTWGLSDKCQLGFGDVTNRNTPTQVGTDSDWSMPAAGSLHSLAIKTNGTIWSWGSNGDGQLGLGDIDIFGIGPAQIGTNPELPDGPAGWTAVFGGNAHTIGIRKSGTIWTCGSNDSGQLGVGDTLSRNTPTLVGE